MSYPQYKVSYAVMNEKAGSNPFHHSFLVLSKQETENSLMKVEKTYGFYSQPSPVDNPIMNQFWNTLGLKFKLKGSHGVLKTEDMRDLDGIGLLADNQNVDEAKYQKLIRICEAQLQFEKEAICEHKVIVSKPEEIYSKEKVRSNALQSPSRLKPFEFVVDMDLIHGIHTKNSYTCKTFALELLRDLGIFNEKEHSNIDSHAFGYAFPRATGGNLTPIYLFSDGPLKPYYSKSSKKTVYHRYWDDAADNNLYFALNPEHASLHKRQGVIDELEALKLLEKKLRKPNNEKETALLLDLQPQFLDLFKRYAQLNDKTELNVVTQLLADSKKLRVENTLQLEPIASNFLLLAWEATLYASFCLSTLALCVALNTLSGSSLAIVAAVSTVSVLASGYGLFSGSTVTPPNSTELNPSTSATVRQCEV